MRALEHENATPAKSSKQYKYQIGLNPLLFITKKEKTSCIHKGNYHSLISKHLQALSLIKSPLS